MQTTARETAGVTTRLILTYARRHGGEAAVGEVLHRSGLSERREALEDERSWSSYDEKIALLRAAGEVLDDDRIGRHVGESLLDEQVGTGLRLLIGSLGSPQQVLRSVTKAQAKFSTSATMATVTTSRTGGEVTYRLHPPNVPDRLDCDYTQGVLSQVSVLFGLPPATIGHPRCQVEGEEACHYEVSWRPRQRIRRVRANRIDVSAPFEADALRQQLDDLHRTVADLVSTRELDSLLDRVAERAGASVRGQRYLLAVELEGERAPRIHAQGFAPEVAADLGAALLAGRTPAAPATRIVTEVASTRHRYGWLAAELPPGQGFLPAEQQQLDAYGRLAAAALDAATALEQARERGATAEALLQLGHELARDHDEIGIGHRLVEAIPTVLGADRAAALVWDGERRRLRPVAVTGYGRDTDRALDFEVETGASDVVAEMEREPRPRWVSARHTDASGRAFLADWRASAYATAPVIVHGRLAALLVAVWDEDRPPGAASAAALDRLGALADQGSTAVAAARALAEARHQARHDATTGLANRRLFTERLEDALADGRRTGWHPVVCFLDLDGFKRVNDVYGHAVGDHLLVAVGQRIQASLRETDLAARLSGDEFGVLLRGVDRSVDAGWVAAKLVAALHEPFEVDGSEVRIGASVGVAAAPVAGATPDELLKAADHAMYEAKREGGTYRTA
jgi:diguanylate cyclase (GGDEF)-like protein